MRHYPIFLDLTERNCLVVGAGSVGTRKLATLLESKVKQVLVIDPHEPCSEAKRMLQHPCCQFLKREFKDQDLADCFLVFACTNDQDLNIRINKLCRKKNILCNVVDQPDQGDFILPALYTQGDLVLAISTGGYSPALSRKIRQQLEHCFGPEYKILTKLLGRVRPLILEISTDSSANRDIFRSLIQEPVLEAIQSQDLDRLKKLMQQRLPNKLHPKLGAICHELFSTI